RLRLSAGGAYERTRELSHRVATSHARRAKTGHTTSLHQKPAYRCFRAWLSHTLIMRCAQLASGLQKPQPAWEGGAVRAGRGPSFLCQQGGDIAQRFLRAVLVIAVFADQALLYD